MRFEIHRYESVTSTMDVCRDLAKQGVEEGTVVVADEQTAGRGRAGHAWYSPSGQSLYLSVLLRPDLCPRQIGWLTMIGALAVLEALNEELRIEKENSYSQFSIPEGSQLTIKWFNDVLLNGKKVSGVLVETSLTDEHVDYAVLGIGLNVNTDFTNAPDDVKARATSLREAFGREFDRETILGSLLDHFGQRYDRLIAAGESPTTEYARHVETLGKPMRLQVGDEIVEGVAKHIEDDGALVIATATSERTMRFGDVLAWP